MTNHDFSDLVPPPELRVQDHPTPMAWATAIYQAGARYGYEQAAERLANQWPELITDRPPTEEDGDEKGYVQSTSDHGIWCVYSWAFIRDRGWPWCHTPRWQPSAPPTLKEQALQLLPEINGEEVLHLCPLEVAKIRRALEADS